MQSEALRVQRAITAATHQCFLKRVAAMLTVPNLRGNPLRPNCIHEVIAASRRLAWPREAKMLSGGGGRMNPEVRRDDDADPWRNSRGPMSGANDVAAGAEPFFRIAVLLANAYWQCAASGLRFASTTTQRLAQGQFQLLDHMRFSDPRAYREQTLRIVVDEARGCLRDLADVAAQELGRLRTELAALQEAARGLLAEEKDTEKVYRRRWKAKL
jgi:hypothetical protein